MLFLYNKIYVYSTLSKSCTYAHDSERDGAWLKQAVQASRSATKNLLRLKKGFPARLKNQAVCF